MPSPPVGPPAAGGEAPGALSDSDNEYDDPDAPGKDEDGTMIAQNGSPGTSTDAHGEVKKKYDPKDPLRPRRKKARRACFACQRAHLTCGDERPCQRCIKRGLSGACQDGVRKKAKYLHDAPPEALGPVLGPNFNTNAPPSRANSHRSRPPPPPPRAGSISEGSSTLGSFYSQTNPPSFHPNFAAAAPPIPTAMTDAIPPPFSNRQSPVSPSFSTAPGNTPLNSAGLSMSQGASDINTLTAALFDPNNPAMFNFNLEGLDFRNQYGAMEFGMLGQMSSGAAETPPIDPPMSTQAAGDGSGSFGQPAMFSSGFNALYDGAMVGDFLGMDPNSSGVYAHGNLQHGLPHAYAIAAGPTSLNSPNSAENNSPQPKQFTQFEPPAMPGPNAFSAPAGSTPNQAPPPRQQPQPPQPTRPRARTLGRAGLQSALGRRSRDASVIYDMVKEPFPYVSSFHRLTELFQRRFSPGNRLRIAKSLGSIRPSFMACTRTLNREDLIFMEKSFQRALFEYDEFMHLSPSPTIVCRRTGEIAGVNKVFTALTGWTPDVLLGREPNLNVNLGMSSGTAGGAVGSNSGWAGGGGGGSSSHSNNNGLSSATTPRMPNLSIGTLDSLALNNPKATSQNHAGGGNGSGTQQQQQQQQQQRGFGFNPVFLAELMDEASVIEFYEDYSQLAFNNSRGRVERKCRLLKYRTQQLGQPGSGNNNTTGATGNTGNSKSDNDSNLSSLVSPAVMGRDNSSGNNRNLGGDGRSSMNDDNNVNKAQQQQQQQQQKQAAEVPPPPSSSSSDRDLNASPLAPRSDPRSKSSILSNRVTKIDGEHGISRLERDGKIECSYTWHIKRDTFDIPMMIVINFLPCYYRNHNQLAV